MQSYEVLRWTIDDENPFPRGRFFFSFETNVTNYLVTSNTSVIDGKNTITVGVSSESGLFGYENIHEAASRLGSILDVIVEAAVPEVEAAANDKIQQMRFVTNGDSQQFLYESLAFRNLAARVGLSFEVSKKRRAYGDDLLALIINF